MILTYKEINELKAICEYLDNDSSEIVNLGLSIYKSKYEDKLKDYIVNITKRYIPVFNCTTVNCNYLDNGKTYCLGLSWAIEWIIDKSNVNINEN